MKLILFDIDGTLIQANGAGKRVLALALQEVFGTAGPIEKYNLGGKTDTQIVTDLLRAAAIPDHQIETNMPTLFAQMAHHGQTVLPTSQATPCPGAKPLLTALQGRSDILLGLVTGNIEPVAPLKLAAAGLDPTIFRVGAYGCQHHDRNQLPPLAMKQATALTKLQFAGYNTIVVGDTPLDIHCARANGAKAIAVATGRYTLATLNQYKPDILLPNLADTETVLQLLLA